MASLRRKASEAIDQLREARRELPDRSRDRRHAMEAASADTSAEARLRHRYEMEHEKSLYAALRELRALAKSGLDLPDEPEAGSEPDPGAASSSGAVAAAPAAPGGPAKSDSNIDGKKTCDNLASVGASPSTETPPAWPAAWDGVSGASPGPDRGRSGAFPGPELTLRFAILDR